MPSFLVEGGHRLKGTICPQGAKNEVLQILCAVLLTPDEVLRIPNEQLLCIVRGCNVLMLNKLDYTRHPYSKMIREVSVYDYRPEISEPFPIEEEIIEEEKPKKKKRIYGSASPPSDF